MSSFSAWFSISPQMCEDEPLPNEAKLTLPLRSLAQATNSFTDFNPRAGGVDITRGASPCCVTGMKSFKPS